MTVATALAYLTGLAFVAPELDLPTLVGTGLALHTCHAIVCRLFARNQGYPPTLWMLLGLVAGLWAVAVLILLPQRAAVPPKRS
jgi:hypothetical protein